MDWSENNFIVKRNYAKSLFCEKDKYKSSMKTLMKYVPIGTWCDKTYSVDWESGSQWKRLLTDNKLTSHIDIFLKDVQGNRSNSTEEIEEFQRYFEHKYKDKNKGTYWILKDYERFDYVYTCYTNKMENASNDLVYPILPKRTTLLNECENKDDRFIVDDDFKVLVDGNYLYKGFRLKFTFKGNKFEWYQGNNVEYDVYLIENNEYKLKDSEAENDIDKYYCFNIDKNENANSFIQKLEDLIKEAYSNDISE